MPNLLPALHNRRTSLFSPRRLFAVMGLVLLMVFSLSGAVIASSIAEDFSGNGTFTPGMLVSLRSDDKDSVELATVNNSEALVGVVEASGNNLMRFGKDGAQVPVATGGVVAAYVSDVNGEIKAGDSIGTSWINGVGMKLALGDEHKVIGLAVQGLNTAQAGTLNGIKTPSGTKSVKVGSIAIRLSDPPGRMSTAGQSNIVSFSKALTGKQTPVIRLLVSTSIFILTLGASALFIRTSIKNSFIAIGRNPMSSRSIYKSLIQVSAFSVVIVIIGTAVAYAVMVL